MRSKTVIISSAFVFFTHWSFSQEEVFHVEKNSQPSELVSYLFSNYGQEATESMLLKIQAYELANDKKVLAAGNYKMIMEKLETEIGTCTDETLIYELLQRKQRFIPLTAIETELH